MAMMKKQWPAADYSIWHLLQKQTTYSPSSLHRLPKCTATLTVALWVLGRGWWQWRWSKVIDLRFGRITPLQYSCLENPMDGGAWCAAVHGVATSRIRLSDFTFTFHFNALEKEMATHSSVLAWRIPETGEPGGLPSMGSHRVGHDWGDLAAAAAESLGLSNRLKVGDEARWRYQKWLPDV